MAKKGTRVVVTECTARTSTDPKRSNGVSRYTTEKNRRNTTERLELKFNPHLNRMTIHKRRSNQIMPNSILKNNYHLSSRNPIDYKDVELLKSSSLREVKYYQEE